MRSCTKSITTDPANSKTTNFLALQSFTMKNMSHFIKKKKCQQEPPKFKTKNKNNKLRNQKSRCLHSAVAEW